MSAKKTDISRIRKYLNGELDARAMHQLEREAQDDPFLMDAIAGYELAENDQQLNLTELDNLLQQRIDQAKTRRIIPWRYISAAASLVLILCIAYLLWPGTKNPVLRQEQLAVKTPPPADHVQTKPDTTPKLTADNNMTAAVSPKSIKSSRQAVIANANPALASSNVNDIRIEEPVGNADTKTNLAQAAPVIKNDKALNDMLKKFPGVQADSAGNIIAHEQAITRVRVNGKDAFGNNVNQAVKNLPADVIEKTQAIDDYGDQATSMAKLNRKGKDSMALKEVTIVGYGTQVKKEAAASTAMISQSLAGKVPGAEVTTPNKVNGRILDELGLPLPGVTVQIVGTQKGTQTDVNGRFSIPTSGNATLSINYIGFESKRIAAKANDSLNIKLKASNMSLSEVVVVGYGQSKPQKSIKEAHPRMGWDNYNKYLKKRATADDGKTGTVRLSFIVGEKGVLSDFKIIKGLSEENNQLAIELVKEGPPWEADASGKPKTVTLKIKFSRE